MIDAGYFSKRVEPKPEWLPVAAVREICSVSNCISGGPDGWFERWAHNEFGWFNRISDALAGVPGDCRDSFRLFAYRLHPEVFRPDGRRVGLLVPPNVKPHNLRGKIERALADIDTHRKSHRPRKR